jgi:ABC-type branched-subunit amino acid transport system permease subunit
MFKNFFFDYFYYRLYSLNKNKGEYQGVPAAVVVSLVQILFVSALIGVAIRAFYDRSVTSPYAKGITYITCCLFIYMCFLNYQKFKNNYEQFAILWKNESRFEKMIKGVVMILVIFLSIVPLILIGIYW